MATSNYNHIPTYIDELNSGDIIHLQGTSDLPPKWIAEAAQELKNASIGVEQVFKPEANLEVPNPEELIGWRSVATTSFRKEEVDLRNAV